MTSGSQNSPGIDVVVPVFNGMPYIKDCVGSCLAQQGVDLRITVVDNCSVDGTREWLRNASKTTPLLRVIENETNIGMAGNILRCFDSVERDYFLFLCADDCLADAHALQMGCRIMDSSSSTGVVYCDMRYINHLGIQVHQRKFHRDGPFDPRRVGFQSILACRNYFGIPLLSRSSLLEDVVWEPTLRYTADVNFAIQAGSRMAAWHIPRALIANRYHLGNATHCLQRFGFREFMEVASRNGYQISKVRKLGMLCSFFGFSIARSLFAWWAVNLKRKGHVIRL